MYRQKRNRTEEKGYFQFISKSEDLLDLVYDLLFRLVSFIFKLQLSLGSRFFSVLKCKAIFIGQRACDCGMLG